MVIDIWSDIMCPFCYIGKRHLEAALKQLSEDVPVEINWHSYLLDPNMVVPEKPQNPYEYLAAKKGMELDESIEMHEYVEEMAARAGLKYRFDIARIANPVNAHRLIQLAKTKGLGDAAEECFFSAYFTEGKDLGDHATMMELGIVIGLPEDEIAAVLSSDAYLDAVQKDLYDAQLMGIRGVPFFLINGKVAISGAQPVPDFVRVLKETAANS